MLRGNYGQRIQPFYFGWLHAQWHIAQLRSSAQTLSLQDLRTSQQSSALTVGPLGTCTTLWMSSMLLTSCVALKLRHCTLFSLADIQFSFMRWSWSSTFMANDMVSLWLVYVFLLSSILDPEFLSVCTFRNSTVHILHIHSLLKLKLWLKPQPTVSLLFSFNMFCRSSPVTSLCLSKEQYRFSGIQFIYNKWKAIFCIPDWKLLDLYTFNLIKGH